MRVGVITVSQPEPKKSRRTVGGTASRSPTRRRASTKKRPAQSSTSATSTSLYGRSAASPKASNMPW